ncbi:MAG: hypothetical protein CVV44_11125 [Spirochaetae bacterium HGW-Spirochaetae-1]|jgi:sugar lactone lactonase YvrE|nr:MAG: hypothetical protein CVV44_11125 [Spirochaetae bacterium HGW-Spirochaetae-1]
MKNTIVIILSIWFFAACGVDVRTSKVITLADVGGNPDGVTVAESGNIYITDIVNGDVKKIDENGTVTLIDNLAGTNPDGITAVTDGTNEILYVTDTGGFTADGTIIKITVQSNGTVTTTTDFVDSTELDNPTGIAVDGSGNIYVADQGTGDVFRITDPGEFTQTIESLTDPHVASADLGEPHGLTLVTNEDDSITLYTTDQDTSSNNIVQIEIPASGIIADIVVLELTAENTGGTDTGTLDSAKFDKPHGISTDGNGAIFVCDENNNRVQVITPSGNVITFAGDGTAGDIDGKAGTAQFNLPRGLCVDADGDLLVCDYGNGKVKKIIR